MANWLYNGVELPELPELTDEQKAIYRYAVIGGPFDGANIGHEGDRYYCFICSNEPFKFRDGYAWTDISCVYLRSYLAMTAALAETLNSLGYAAGYYEWGNPPQELEAKNDVALPEPVWTNRDIYNEDDSLYLAASAPIRVDSKLSISVGGHTAGDWMLSESIITTDGEDANDGIVHISNIDDEMLLAVTYSCKLYRSYDGMTWDYVADAPIYSSKDIIRVNGVYYLHFNKSLYYSENLTEWNACTFPDGHPCNTVNSWQYSDGIFICTASNLGDGTYIYRSTDGKDWSATQFSSSSNLSTWAGSFMVYYHPEPDVWFARAVRTNLLYYSQNGTSWSKVLNYDPVPFYNDGVFIARIENDDASPRYSELLRSTDGKNWECVYHEDIDDSVPSYYSGQLNVTFLKGVWYASSSITELSYRSADKGKTWERFYDLSEVKSAIYAFDKYWLSNGSETIVSDDGESWVSVGNSHITRCVYEDDLALYYAEQYSTDGINWHNTNIKTAYADMFEEFTIDTRAPIRFRNMWVSFYEKYTADWLDDGLCYEARLLYLPTHSTVTETMATVKFGCSNLLYTDSVYHIQAWVYKKSDGLNTAASPTWTSEIFAGAEHSESYTFRGLTPDTEYEVYAVIVGGDTGTDHNALTSFITAKSDDSGSGGSSGGSGDGDDSGGDGDGDGDNSGDINDPVDPTPVTINMDSFLAGFAFGLISGGGVNG